LLHVFVEGIVLIPGVLVRVFVVPLTARLLDERGPGAEQPRGPVLASGGARVRCFGGTRAVYGPSACLFTPSGLEHLQHHTVKAFQRWHRFILLLAQIVTLAERHGGLPTWVGLKCSSFPGKHHASLHQEAVLRGG
jgi:hypothetical protein